MPDREPRARYAIQIDFRAVTTTVRGRNHIPALAQRGDWGWWRGGDLIPNFAKPAHREELQAGKVLDMFYIPKTLGRNKINYFHHTPHSRNVRISLRSSFSPQRMISRRGE